MGCEFGCVDSFELVLHDGRKQLFDNDAGSGTMILAHGSQQIHALDGVPQDDRDFGIAVAVDIKRSGGRSDSKEREGGYQQHSGNQPARRSCGMKCQWVALH